MRLYHVICITHDNKEISENVNKEIQKFFQEKQVEIVSSNTFLYNVVNMRKYKNEQASFLVYKVKIDPKIISSMYNEIRNNITDILVLRIILLTGNIKDILNSVQ